ncbi:MAG: cob(I)yrinic acid a,c-diamide adenosyltransferase [Ktedonobacteraceae bacterium]|nr:cob(I)yrinic acid a,c-diamide adenosyltransferase [Ktedonobacteraceae bacterium]
MFFTRRGDDGYTDLLGGGRVAKEDRRITALGDVDEATAAIGVSRATATQDDTKRALLHVQKDLYWLMADLATVAGKMADQPRLSSTNIDELEAIIAEFDSRVSIPKEFVASGDSLAGAHLHVARTVVRRAERTVTQLLHAGTEGGEHEAMVGYLNRLSSLLFGLACYEDQAAGAQPTLSKAIKE